MDIVKRDPADCSYFLANRNCFFHRFADSGFRNKWTGLWSQERKILEYYALQVDGEWLSPSNMERVEYDFAKAVHYYKTEKGIVKETLFIPEDSNALAVCVEFPHAMVEIKLAVNIRKRCENATGRRYTVEQSGGTIAIGNELGRLYFSSGSVSFSWEERYENHMPCGEEQNYFVPGRITMNGPKVVFMVGPEPAPPSRFEEMLERKQRVYRFDSGLMKSDNRKLNEGFQSAVLSLELLKKSGGYWAGLPWFQQEWGRDTFWSLPAIIDVGRHAEAKKLLEYFAQESEGRIPNFISLDDGKKFNSIDATLLWLISMEHYVKNSGDIDFAVKTLGKIEGFMKFLFSREKGGFLEHDTNESETWMDTLKRPSSAVEVQAMWYRALLACAHIYALAGRREAQIHAEKKARALEEKFDSEFYHSGFYADRTWHGGFSGSRTANALVPVFMGPGRKWKEILKHVESDCFDCDRGVRTLAAGEPGFNPSGYHTGSVWSLTTGWAAAAEFACGRPDEGWEFLLKLMDTRSGALGCVGECWDSFSGRLTGCGLQLWGAAFVVRIIDEFLLGIDIDVPAGVIKVSPSLPDGVNRVERVKLFGEKEVRIFFERAGDDVRVWCGDPSVKLIKG